MIREFYLISLKIIVLTRLSNQHFYIIYHDVENVILSKRDLYRVAN